MSVSRPTITVLVPTFNRADFLQECLDSLLVQTLPPVQILVINDGSTDRTQEILRAYTSRLEVLETAQLGKPGALNAGLERTRGEYVWIFDDDDVAFADALERLVTPLEKDPQAGFSFGTFYYTATDPQTHRIGKIQSTLEIPNLQERGFLAPLLENNFLGGAALFARTSCYHEVGLFDPTLVRSQDYEMAVRLAKRFRGVRVEGPPLFHYRQHEGFRGSTQDRFPGRYQLEKWLEYDRIIFRRLYQELPLEDYLPAGTLVSGQRRRQALLQRLEIMAVKRLPSEALRDLDELSRMDDEGALSKQERFIIKRLADCWHPETGYWIDQSELFEPLCRYAQTSRPIQRIRRQLAIELFFQAASKLTPDTLRALVRRWTRLY